MSQSKASGRKSVAGMGSIRKKEKVINGKAYTYYEARYTVGIDPGTGKQIQKSISGKTQREVTRRLKEITTSIEAAHSQQLLKANQEAPDSTSRRCETGRSGHTYNSTVL